MRANAINHELNTFVHGIDGRDGECEKLGNWGEVHDSLFGLVGIFEEVSDSCIEEGGFVRVLGVGGVFLLGTWQKVGKAILGAASAFGIINER